MEILISAVYEMAEVQSVAMQENGCGPLAALVLSLIKSEIPSSHHRVVSLAVLELYMRRCKVAMHHQSEFPKVLSTFIGNRGIRHPSEVLNKIPS